VSVPRRDGIILAAIALTIIMGEQGQHGAQNWVYVSFAHHDTRSGEYTYTSVSVTVIVSD
jgi:hypothetical protein